MKAEAIYGAGTMNMSVRVEGLADLMRFLKDANKDLQKAMRRSLEEAVQPVLDDARANASRIADDGTMHSSLSLSGRANGSKWVLKSDDPAAGVKEFANPGAIGRHGQRVGVPHRANKPRVMVSAVEKNTDKIIENVDNALARVMDRA